MHSNADDALYKTMTALVPAVLRYACALVNDAEDAEDVAQDALAAAWRERKRFDAGRVPQNPHPGPLPGGEGGQTPVPQTESLRAWLFGFVRNYARKSRTRRRAEPLDDVTMEAIAADPLLNDDTASVAMETMEALERCIEHLDAEAAAIMNSYYGDPGPDALAKALGMKQGTLRQKVHRARLTLRRCIETRLRLPQTTAGAIEGHEFRPTLVINGKGRLTGENHD